MVEEIFDDRILTWGSHPRDLLKFWNSKEGKDTIKIIAEIGMDISNNHELLSNVKADCLRKIAIVLCDALQFEDAEAMASAAMIMEKCPDQRNEIEVVLIYAIHNKF